jgi:hypothetical protein
MKESMNSTKREKLKKWHDSAWLRVCRTSLLSDDEIRCSALLIPLIYLIAMLSDYTWIASMPDALFDPPAYSPAILANGFPSFIVLAILQSVLALSIACLALGKRPILCGSIFCVVFVILCNFKYSFGKIDHGILPMFTVLCVAVGVASSHLKESKLMTRLFPVRAETLLALVITFGMFTAGFEKSTNWIDFDMSESGFLKWFYGGYLNKGRVHLLADLVPHLHPLIIEGFDYIAVVFELSPLLSLLLGRPLYWRLWLTFACFFHIGNLLFLNIAFISSLVVYLPFLLPKNLVKFVSLKKVRVWLMVIIGILATWAVVSTWTDVPRPLSLLIQGTVMRLWFSLILWGALGACGVIKCVELYRAESPSRKS